ncbi:unnamed protein product [Spirodela intermedia]|uniref:Uncharacterized protein n=1 Tax=Spirodela intermedia TaxID=51605 RepID=A0ABN7EDW2_SPIIN|nr:unnamed protein product [Spirodela intermedia]
MYLDTNVICRRGRCGCPTRSTCRRPGSRRRTCLTPPSPPPSVSKNSSMFGAGHLQGQAPP